MKAMLMGVGYETPSWTTQMVGDEQREEKKRKRVVVVSTLLGEE